ncbi:glycosyltransferase [Leptothermofonsia sichuanensis E412]|uniref:glycosyltransferase n=1 Tax=Leptothermofonsia sichuanensis TaxID=2917832 RepID=UPI001CA76FD4|nr:glycosyltransferase [Leptothermofonsia sichuanensis]QZZ20081.1 glycosyltransferase [Leptothermofonsia sichuanensis E412]
MHIAYLVNQYPKVSHSFIRREILAVEACGVAVSRFSIRSLDAELVDGADRQEFEKTRFVLGGGVARLLVSLIQIGLTRPQPFLKAVQLVFKVGWKSDRGMIIHLAYLAEACVLLKWFAGAKVNHVHAHFGTNSTTVAMLCHVLGGPSYSFTVHGPEEFDKPAAIALTEKINRAAFVVAVCSFGKSQLFRWCDYRQWSKIQVIRCGVDQTFLAQPAIPIPPQPRFVCVARLSEQKGHLMLIEAASQLAREGHSFKLILVGDGPLRGQIEAMIAQLGLQDQVEITGWATNADVQQQLIKAQVMVLPSFAEGLPVGIMESLALCRPVISTYIAGIPELVEPGKCGWLVPSGSVDALANAMRMALQTPVEELERMGKNGAELVARYHDAATEAQKLVELFQTCAKGDPG